MMRRKQSKRNLNSRKNQMKILPSKQQLKLMRKKKRRKRTRSQMTKVSTLKSRRRART